MSFDVVLGDLDRMRQKFESEGDHITDVRAKLHLDAQDTGNGELDRVLELALEGLKTLHTHVANLVDTHAAELRAAHDEYGRAEGEGYQLFDRLMTISEDQNPGGNGDQ